MLYFVLSQLQNIRPYKIILIFILLLLPTIFAPFHADDFFHLLLLDQTSSLHRGSEGTLFGLFSFVDNDIQNRQQLLRFGVLPWWVSDTFYFSFWRPLAEVSHWFDFHLAPYSAMWAHIHSLCWLLLIGWPLSLLVRKTLEARPLLIYLAVAIFLWDGQHVATVSWIANRAALMAAFFSLFCLYFHLQWVTQSGVARLFAALTCLLLALACGEIALSITLYLFFYGLILDPRGWLKGLAVLWPYAVVVLLYLYMYQKLGFGADTSLSFYISPLSHPSAFFDAALQRFMVYLLAAFTPVMSGALWIGGQKHAWLGQGILLAACAFLPILMYCSQAWLKSNKAMAFWFFSGVFSILPVCSALAQDRLTLFQTIGIDVFIAAIIYYSLLDKHSKIRQVRVAKILLFFHLILSPLHLLAGSLFMQQESQRLLNHALNFNQGKDLSGKKMLIFEIAVGQSSTLMGMREVNKSSLPDSVFIAAGVEGELKVYRQSYNQLVLTRTPGFVTGYETAFRSVEQQPFVVGQTFVMDDVIVEVVSLDKKGHPDNIVLTLDMTSESFDVQNNVLSEWVFYSMNNGLKELRLPALGESITL